MAILEVHRIGKSFGGVRAIHQLDLAVQEGEILGLIGPNGSGKTTLFNLIAGALKIDEGSIRFRGKDVTRAPCHQRCAGGIARTFQIPKPFIHMAILRNVMVGRFYGRNPPGGMKQAMTEAQQTGGSGDLTGGPAAPNGSQASRGHSGACVPSGTEGRVQRGGVSDLTSPDGAPPTGGRSRSRFPPDNPARRHAPDPCAVSPSMRPSERSQKPVCASESAHMPAAALARAAQQRGHRAEGHQIAGRMIEHLRRQRLRAVDAGGLRFGGVEAARGLHQRIEAAAARPRPAWP